MIRFIKLTILVFCLIALVAATPTNTNVVDYGQISEDIDIMARIIDKTLADKYPDEYKIERGFAFFGESSGCRGIYLKGYGIVFITSIGFPMSEKAIAHQEAVTEDLWEQTRNELKGTPGDVLIVSPFTPKRDDSSTKYNPERVEKLKEELVKAIGKYAPNIRNLDSQENIIIAVQEKPWSFNLPLAVTATTPESKFTTQDTRPGAPELIHKTQEASINYQVSSTKYPESPDIIPTHITETVPEAPVPLESYPGDKTFKYITPGEKAYRRTTMVIKIKLQDAVDFKNGSLNLDNLIQKADIMQY